MEHGRCSVDVSYDLIIRNKVTQHFLDEISFLLRIKAELLTLNFNYFQVCWLKVSAVETDQFPRNTALSAHLCCECD